MTRLCSVTCASLSSVDGLSRKRLSSSWCLFSPPSITLSVTMSLRIRTSKSAFLRSFSSIKPRSVFVPHTLWPTSRWIRRLKVSSFRVALVQLLKTLPFSYSFTTVIYWTMSNLLRSESLSLLSHQSTCKQRRAYKVSCRSLYLARTLMLPCASTLAIQGVCTFLKETSAMKSI